MPGPTRLLVSVGTDGFTDWIRLPTGQKMNLGPLSVMSFVTKLIGAKRQGKQVIEAYLRQGEAMLNVDEDRMWDLLTPVRVRWASGGSSFMALDSRTARKGTMTTIRTDLNNLERHIVALNQAAPLKAAGKVTQAKMNEGLEILNKLAQKIKSPNQSTNATYYGLGAPDVYQVGDAGPKPFEVGDATPAPVTVTASDEGLAFDTIQANSATAQTILAKANETVAKIDKLAQAGKKFNAAKAKSDVHAVTSKVAGILKMDLTASWVMGDLAKLATRTEQLHKLFASAKV